MRKFLLFIIMVVSVHGLLVFRTMALEEQELDGTLIAETIPEIYIKAINPGYTIDGVSNVGEMIEIGRKNSNAPISLAGLTVGYTNSSGNYAVIAEFPENSIMVGESILLRLASSPNSELAAMNYTKTLAMKAGPLELKRGDEILDSVCWTGKNGCASPFVSTSLTTLVRDLGAGEFTHQVDYAPVYVEGNYYLDGDAADDEKDRLPSQCKNLMFSEILSYYESSQSEQFIEFYNTGSEQILLDGCQIKYKNKKYTLSGILKPESYVARYLSDFSLTKNPTSSNILEIIDVNGEVVDRLEYPNGQKKGSSYAFIGYDDKGKEIWRVTYAVTPGEPNNYQEFKTCEEGKVINEKTGNCVKAISVTEKVCAEGQYLNPLTGRCKKIETTKEKVCKEGYYLNEETGRCKKIVENKGAQYGLEPEDYREESSFVALYAIGGVILVGVGYLVYEFRYEIMKFFGKVFRRFH